MSFTVGSSMASTADFFAISSLSSGFCAPGGCSACPGCGPRSIQEAVRTDEYKPASAPADVAALLYDSWHTTYWTGGKLHTPTVVTYSFGDRHSGFTAGEITGWSMTSTGRWTLIPEDFREVVREAARLISAQTGIQLVETAEPDRATIIWRAEEFAETSGLGVPSVPGPDRFGGDIWLNLKNEAYWKATDFRPGTEGFVFVLHEFGHVLGLKHIAEGGFAKPELGTRAFTVMSHVNSPDGKVLANFTARDIQALSYVYGSHDTKASLPVQWAQLTGGGLVSKGDESANLIAGIEDRDWMSGGGGGDTLVGLHGNDMLDGGAGDNVILGGLGEDTMVLGARHGGGAYVLNFAADPDEAGAMRGRAVLADGSHTFSGIERIQFLDGVVDLRTGAFRAGSEAIVADRLAKIIFGRQAKDTELKSALQLLGRDGKDTLDLAREMILSSGIPAEATSLGALSRLYDALFPAGAMTDLLLGWQAARNAGVGPLAEFAAALADTVVVRSALGGEIRSLPGAASSGQVASSLNVGWSANSALSGGPGRDAFMSFGGNSEVRGGEGYDILYVDASSRAGWDSGMAADRSYDGGVNGWIRTASGTVTFSDIEEIRFTDASLHFGVTSDAGVIYRIYDGLLDRAPTRGELGAALQRIASGAARAQDIAEDIVLGAEFVGQWGLPSLDRIPLIIDQFYTRVLGRAPTADEAVGWGDVVRMNGFAQFGWMATEAATRWGPSIESSRAATSSWQWADMLAPDEVTLVFRFLAQRDMTEQEKAYSLLRMEQGGIGLHQQASDFIGWAGLSGLSDTAFAAEMLQRATGAGPAAAAVEQLARLLAAGALDRASLVLLAVDDKETFGPGGTLGAGAGIGNPNTYWKAMGPADFDGDGKADLLWRGQNGEVNVWRMDRAQVLSGGQVGNPGTYWSIADTGDFDGDGRADLLWRGQAGEVGVWRMDGTRVISGGQVGNPGTYWSIAGTGDFDSDGRVDLLWRGQAGEVGVWRMDGTQVLSGGQVGNPGTYWSIAGTGDFDGDGRADLLWRGQAGEVGVWRMDGTQVLSGGQVGNPGTYWQVAGAGDLNGDGKDEIVWRGGDGEVVIWQMSGVQIVSDAFVGSPGTYWQIVDLTDLNADGRHDLVFRGGAGEVVIWTMNGAQVASVTNPGSPWDLIM